MRRNKPLDRLGGKVLRMGKSKCKASEWKRVWLKKQKDKGDCSRHEAVKLYRRRIAESSWPL